MRLLPAGLLVFLLGCGNAALLSGPDLGADFPEDLSDRSVQSGDCDPDRALRLMIVTESATLLRALPQTGLDAGTVLPAFDAAAFGLDDSGRAALMDRLHALARQTLEPLGVEVIGDLEEVEGISDAEALAPDTGPAELISRIILTQAAGVPQHCGCQGSTGGLGLPEDGLAEGAVFTNAFVDNGLARALQRYPMEERIEKLATALANSVLHEAGHTLGLVHLDIAGQPTLLMARGGSSASKVSLSAITTLQSFSVESLPVTADALAVRDVQCDTCTIGEALEARRLCRQ